MRDFVFAIVFAAIILGGIHFFFLAGMDDYETERTAELEREVEELKAQLEAQQEAQQEMNWAEWKDETRDRVMDAMRDEFRVDSPAPYYYVPEMPSYDYDMVENYLDRREQREIQRALRDIEHALRGW